MLHGPFLYHLIPFSYYFFGITKWATRLPIVLLSTILLFLPLLLKRIFRPTALLIVVAMFSLSPEIVYWSRFIRHDLFTIFFSALFFIFITQRHNRAAIFAAYISLILTFCIKENAYIHSFILMVFVIFDFLFFRDESLLNRFIKSIGASPITHLLAFLLAATIYSYFYSAGFQYIEGIYDGLFRKSVMYWFEQHSVERIAGPFLYPTLILSFYDPLIIVFTGIHILHFYLQAEPKYWVSFSLVLLLSLFLYIFIPPEVITSSAWSSFFKIKIPKDFILYFPLLIHGICVTFNFLEKRERSLAFWGFFSFSLLFTYSFLGEKVPWLSLYPLFSLIIFLTLYFQKNIYTQKIFLLVFPIVLLCYLPVNIKLNLGPMDGPDELIYQVHTTPQYETLSFNLLSNLKINKKVLALGQNTWPLSWYLYGQPNYQYFRPTKGLKNFDFVLADLDDLEIKRELSATHSDEVIPMRWWWQPDYNELDFKNFWNYLIYRKPWNSPGYSNIIFFKKNY